MLCVAVMVLAMPAMAAAQSVVCTDASRTNCTVKKNQPFSVTNDAALASDTVPTEKWRIYVDGARVGEQANTGLAPVFLFAAGLAAPGQHTVFTEAVATVFDTNGQLQEIASGPSNVATINVVTGSLSAPKNLRVVGGGG